MSYTIADSNARQSEFFRRYQERPYVSPEEKPCEICGDDVAWAHEGEEGPLITECGCGAMYFEGERLWSRKIDIVKIEEVENLTVDGVYIWDHPDYVDAFFDGGNWKKSGKALTEEELDALTQQYPGELNYMAYGSRL